MKRILRSVAACCLLMIAACGDSTKAPDTATKSIGATGGTVTSAGGAGVTVPAGAVATDTSFSLTEVTSTVPLSIGQAVGPVYKFGPSGATFTQPVTMTLPFSESLLPAGVDKTRDLIVLTAPDGTTNYTSLGRAQVNGTIASAQTTHFSLCVVAVGPERACLRTCGGNPQTNVCTDSANCGACGTTCPSSQTCASGQCRAQGACTPTCPSGSTCGGEGVCGACSTGGSPCGRSSTNAGTCCAQGQTCSEGGQCVTPAACSPACTGARTCVSGQCQCASGTACGTSACCQSGQTCTNNQCVTTATCTPACPSGSTCGGEGVCLCSAGGSPCGRSSSSAGTCCAQGQTCTNNQCMTAAPTCTPACLTGTSCLAANQCQCNVEVNCPCGTRTLCNFKCCAPGATCVNNQCSGGS